MMAKDFLLFFEKLFVFSIVIASIVFFLSKGFALLVGSYTWFSLLYFFIITLVFHYGLLKSVQGKPQQFFRYFMAATTLKMALHLMVVVGYSLTYRSNAVNFIVGFFLLYVLFTAFEVRQAIKINK